MRPSVLLVLAGCGFNVPSAQAVDDAHPLLIDAPDIDASKDCVTWLPHDFHPCELPAPAGGLDLNGASPYTYNTTSGVLTDMAGTPIAQANAVIMQSDQSPARVISVSSLRLRPGIRLNVVGSLPLIVAAWDSIQIEGILDGGSHRGGNLGPGAGAATCNAPGAAVSGPSGSGAGGGGGFGAAGGHGGIGDNNLAGGTGGLAVGAPAVVRGGCVGGNGAHETSGNGEAAGNDAISHGTPGGGAVQLTARATLKISGKVLAGGGGGSGCPTNSASGGGGGGSGGYLGIEAPSITLQGGTLVSNGGGGGGGCSHSNTGNGGADAAEDVTAATGGAAQTCGSAGGVGSLGGVGGITLGIDSCGGGGGGGGAGYILIRGTPTVSTLLISPLPLLL